MIRMLSRSYPIALVCDVLGCARSSYYYRPRDTDHSALAAAIESLATAWPTYGSRRITAELRRQGWEINRKRDTRLMKEMGLCIKRKAMTATGKMKAISFTNRAQR